MSRIRSEYKVSSQVLTKNNVQWQFIDKDLQKQPWIFFFVKHFSSFLSTSSHYSLVKVLNSSWLFRSCIWGSKVQITNYRSSRPEVFLEKSVRKICRKFTGEHPCRSATSIKLLCNFIEIALWHGCSPVNLLHISRAPFPKNTSGCLLLCLSISADILQTQAVIFALKLDSF